MHVQTLVEPIPYLHDILIGAVKVGRYSNGRLAIEFADDEGFPAARPTVNVPEYELEEGQILLKDWSENKGTVVWFAERGYVNVTGLKAMTGHVYAIVVELTSKGREFLNIPEDYSTLSYNA